MAPSILLSILFIGPSRGLGQSSFTFGPDILAREPVGQTLQTLSPKKQLGTRDAMAEEIETDRDLALDSVR